MFDHTTQDSIEISTNQIDRKWIDINIPCKTACPIMTDIPGYIQAIMEGDYETAYRINRMDNVLPSVLGRVCHRPCESVCRHGWDGLGCLVLKSVDKNNSYPHLKEEGVKLCQD
jgi:hypothetical protein